MAYAPAIIAAGGAVAGAAKGGKGTPDQVVQKEIAPAGQQEQDLQRQSLENYASQQQIVNDLQQRLGLYDQLQSQAIGNSQDILSGQALQLTPQEEQQLSSLRQALIDQSQAPVQQLIDTNLRKVNSSAGQRNLRGQALTEQTGRVLSTGAEQLGAASRNAATQVAQAGLQLPYQRIAAQQNALNQGLNLRNSLAQQAIANRQISQQPYLLQSLLSERMGGAETRIPGQGGGWADALLGGVAGAGGSLENYGNLRSAFNNFGATGQTTQPLPNVARQPGAADLQKRANYYGGQYIS